MATWTAVRTVVRVIDGDSFEVSPEWQWNGYSGNQVRIADFYAPELDKPGGQEAKDKLAKLIDRQSVTLKNANTLSFGRLVCDVFLNDDNITQWLKP